jgi:hypothetical protein
LMISPLCCNNVPASGFHSFWRVFDLKVSE